MGMTSEGKSERLLSLSLHRRRRMQPQPPTNPEPEPGRIPWGPPLNDDLLFRVPPKYWENLQAELASRPRPPKIPARSVLCTYRGHHAEVSALAWSPDGQRL